jgi:glycosyltransferase involved in cell wall biosynthesis
MLTTDAVGGVWRQCIELAAGLASRGAEILLVVMGPRPNAAQRAEASGVEGCEFRVTDLPLDWTAESPDQIRHAAQELAALAAEWGADTIQLHAPALLADAEWPAPVAVMVHSCVGTWWRAVRGGELPPDLSWRAALTRDGLLAADAVLAPSRSFAGELASFYRLCREVHVVPNGRQPFEISRMPRPHALTVGRLWDEGKNIRVLDEAAEHVPIRAAGPIAGPNGAVVATRNLKLLGTLGRARLACEYARAAVFVSVARYEPFGLAVLEAAQAGCALLLSDIGTFRELWDGAAQFVDSGDAVGVAGCLRALIDAPETCTGLGAIAKSRAELFTPEAMVDATWAVHRSLLTAPTAVAAE